MKITDLLFPPHRRRRRRKYTKKQILIFLIMLPVFIFVLYFSEVEAESPSENPKELLGIYQVVRVIDGDTIIVNINGEHERVRLIGIDTPELGDPGGDTVRQHVTWLLYGQGVYLKHDVSERDRFGRLLAYVHLNDGVTMLNRLLIERGYATVMTVPPNIRYADEFYALQETARRNGNGFWGMRIFD